MAWLHQFRLSSFTKDALVVALVLCIGGSVLPSRAWASGGFASWLQNIPWLGPVVAGWFSPHEEGFQLYAQPSGSQKEQARSLFKEALVAKEQGQWLKSIELLKRAEPMAPGLKDVIALHLGDLYAKLPDEAIAQLRYKVLLEECPNSPLRVKALYSLGQSQLRGGNAKKAVETFKRVKEQYPNSEWATGALYYLGSAATGNEQLKLWESYVEKAPEGRFSLELANALLQRLPGGGNAQQKQAIGLALVAQKSQLPQAISLLNAVGITNKTWWPLAQAYLATGKLEEAQLVIEQQLGRSVSQKEAEKALDALLLATPKAKQLGLLKQLQGKPQLTGSDFVLWRLSQLEPANALYLYKAIHENYPKSPYAPESSWALSWNNLLKGNDQAFLTQAIEHMQAYPYSQSAARTLFWMGQVYERSNLNEQATKAYQTVIEKTPWDYYAYRSHQHLELLRQGKSKQPMALASSWGTSAQNAVQASAKASVFSLKALLEENLPAAPNATGLTVSTPALVAVMQELALLGAKEDLSTYATEAFAGKLPVPVEAWLLQQQGQMAAGMKRQREFMLERYWRTGKAPSTQELLLLYPLQFESWVNAQARQNALDPWLVLSLMREESYFNPLALSGSYAMGLMQLLPSTAKDVAGWVKRPNFQATDLFKPEVNIQLGSRYLRYLHEQFAGQSQFAVGAYNGGPNAMKGWMKSNPDAVSANPDFFVESIPYQESRLYIQKVFASYWNYRRLYAPDGLGLG